MFTAFKTNALCRSQSGNNTRAAQTYEAFFFLSFDEICWTLIASWKHIGKIVCERNLFDIDSKLDSKAIDHFDIVWNIQFCCVWYYIEYTNFVWIIKKRWTFNLLKLNRYSSGKNLIKFGVNKIMNRVHATSDLWILKHFEIYRGELHSL